MTGEPKINLRDAIGIALIAAFIGSAFVLFWKEIPRSNEQLISYILGQLSGFVSAIVAFHYVTKAGEKELDAQRVDNTSKALDAIKAAASSTPGKDNGAAEAADDVADAAVDKADEFKGPRK